MVIIGLAVEETKYWMSYTQSLQRREDAVSFMEAALAIDEELQKWLDKAVEQQKAFSSHRMSQRKV